MEMMVKAGAIRRAKLQLNCRHQQTNTKKAIVVCFYDLQCIVHYCS